MKLVTFVLFNPGNKGLHPAFGPLKPYFRMVIFAFFSNKAGLNATDTWYWQNLRLQVVESGIWWKQIKKRIGSMCTRGALQGMFQKQ